MKVFKIAVAVGLAVTLGAGLTACGERYTGEGVVIEKEVARHKIGSKVKSSRTYFEITVDVPNSDTNEIVNVTKSKYNALQIGQTVKVEDGKIP